MQLRNCTAEVNSYPVLTVIDRDRKTHVLHNASVLISYASTVAAYADGKLYLFPRHGYSKTTWMHLRKFIEDYCYEIPSYYKSDLYSNDDVIMCDGFIMSNLFYTY